MSEYISNQVLPAIQHKLNAGRVGEAIAYAVSEVTGGSLYERILRNESDQGIVTRTIQGNTMHLDLQDTGISQELLLWGWHEKKCTEVFREVLFDLRSEVNGEISVLEIGANLGYFALIEADALGERASIYAVEPVPKNMELVRRSVNANGYENRFTLSQQAIGVENGMTEIHLSQRSNCARVGELPPFDATDKSTEVRQQTVDAFLDENGLMPSDVNVIRMDIEGFEAFVFPMLEPILTTDTPKVIFVEIHRRVREEGDLEGIVNLLEHSGFKVESAVHDTVGTIPPVEIGGWDDIREYKFKNENIGVIAKNW